MELAAVAACMLNGIERAVPMLKFELRGVEMKLHGARQDSPPKLISIDYQIIVDADEDDRRLDLLHTNVRKFGTIFNTVAGPRSWKALSGASPYRHEPRPRHGMPETTDLSPAFRWAVGLNAGFVVIELTAGLATGLLALIADAAHNLTDVAGLLIAWGAAVLANRPPSSRFTSDSAARPYWPHLQMPSPS